MAVLPSHRLAILPYFLSLRVMLESIFMVLLCFARNKSKINSDVKHIRVLVVTVYLSFQGRPTD